MKKFLILTLVYSSAMCSELSILKEDCLSIIERYNNGTIYVDDKPEISQSVIQYFQTNSPFKTKNLYHIINSDDLSAVRDQYLRLTKRIVRGIFAEEDNIDYDIPHNPKIMREYAYSYVPGEAFNTLRSLMEKVEEKGVIGDFVEAGVFRGGVPMFMKAFLRAYANQERKVWVIDSFAGWEPATDDPDSLICNNDNVPWIVVPLEQVKENFNRHNLLDDQVVFLKGWVKDTLPTAPIENIAILRIDVDLYQCTKDVLESLYPKLAVGGYVIIDDYYCFPGCDRAVDEYRKLHNINDQLFRQASTAPGVYWEKTHN